MSDDEATGGPSPTNTGRSRSRSLGASAAAHLKARVRGAGSAKASASSANLVREESDSKLSGIAKTFNKATKGLKQFFTRDDEHFHNLFKQLPDSEKLIDDFSCALQRDILVQGRLYVSQNFFCFHANILGWETMLILKCKDISAIKKEKTALVIPNAISVATHDMRYTFSSFVTRDEAYRCLFRVWQNSLLDEPENVEQLQEYASLHWKELGRASSLQHLDASLEKDQPSVETPRGPHARQTSGGSGGSESPSPSPQPETDSSSEDDVGEATVADETVACGCPAEEHAGVNFIDNVFDLPVEVVYDLLFGHNSQFMTELMHERKTKDIHLNAWKKADSGRLERSISYTLSLKGNPLGPKSALGVEDQWHVVAATPGKRYIVGAEVTTPKVPYGDNFHTIVRYCITAVPKDKCRLKVFAEMGYRKSPPWAITRGIIEKSGMEGLKSYFDHLSGNLAKVREGSSFLPSMIGPPTIDSNVQVIRPVSRSTSVRDVDNVSIASVHAAGGAVFDEPPSTIKTYLPWIVAGLLFLLNILVLWRLSGVSAQLAELQGQSVLMDSLDLQTLDADPSEDTHRALHAILASLRQADKAIVELLGDGTSS
eukprot:m.292342 g.292342  ORF g.292342 m.292342 type:complete len:600 (-) comp12614_c0_seq1:205-2004(-)